VPLLATVPGLSLLGSCGGLLVASSLLLFNDSVRQRLVPGLVSYAVGALLGVALLALLPEALTLVKPGQIDTNSLRQVVLIGAGVATIVIFERLVG